MATRRQIKANRANAKLSTGPKTEAGKQIVSQNAVTHGLFSKAVVLKTESSRAFEEHLASMITEFKPQTANDHALIETMAIATWRLARIATLMTATFEIQMALQDPSIATKPPINASIPGRLPISSKFKPPGLPKPHRVRTSQAPEPRPRGHLGTRRNRKRRI